MNVSENVIQEKPDSIWEEKGSNISNDELCNILKPVTSFKFQQTTILLTSTDICIQTSF